ncbi:unnamed protein product [Trifolium pratense]|uniref:Uncharacterized protein n=1 Tax=Trifolium pratense TaxID=57577 RepID=A0ACB0IDU9_TRIPR|nr:unnamed protein product [Trifolium pratense]
MTSASELFYTRRHRLGRNDIDSSFQSSPTPDFHPHRIHDSDDDDSLRIRRHVRRPRHPERAPDRFDGRYRRALLNDSVDSVETVRRGERLPVDVRLARERLLQRLRGGGGGGSERLPVDRIRFRLLHSPTKKPPGLTQEALDCLHVKVFSSSETSSESRALQDCGICLESFTDGDKLIHLQCGHKFHSACLDPWIRSCGDCPFCRRCIVVNSQSPSIK